MALWVNSLPHGPFYEGVKWGSYFLPKIKEEIKIGECYFHGTTVDPRFGCAECNKEGRGSSKSVADIKWEAHENLKKLCEKDNNKENNKKK